MEIFDIMWFSSLRIRQAVPRPKVLPTVEKGKDMELKKRINEYHKYLFVLIGFASASNLNSSLLTENVFNCENFANKCNFAFFFSGFISFLIASFFLTLNFKSLLILGWTLVPIQFSLVMIGFIGNGISARNSFIIVYAFHGMLEGFIIQSCTFVISQFFLNSTIALVFAGYPAANIALGYIQYVLENIIGMGTMFKMRLCLVLCLIAQMIVTFVGFGWATFLYIKYASDETENPPITYKWSRFKRFLKALTHIRYYYPRFLLSAVANFVRIFFFPCFIPFTLRISHTAKLLISLTFTFCDFIGIISASRVNEIIDPSTKKESQTHTRFLFLRDIHLHIIGLLVLATCSFILWITCLNKYDFVRSPETIFFITVVTSFLNGRMYGRGLNGCNPILEYYNRQVDDDGTKIVADEILEMDNTVNDVAIVLEYALSALSSSFSNITEQIISQF